MGKIFKKLSLGIMALILMVGVSACGPVDPNKPTATLSNEQYYEKFLQAADNLNIIQNSDYTIEEKTYSINRDTNGDTSNVSQTKDMIYYDKEANIQYYKSTSRHEMSAGTIIQSNISQTWLRSEGEQSYKYYNGISQNISNSVESTNYAQHYKYVIDEENIGILENQSINSLILDNISDSYENFAKSVIVNLLKMSVKVINNVQINFQKIDEKYIFTFAYETEVSGLGYDDANVSIAGKYSFDDNHFDSASVEMKIVSNDVELSYNKVDVGLNYTVDNLDMDFLPKSEFEDVVARDDYTVNSEIFYNDISMYYGYAYYKENIISELNRVYDTSKYEGVTFDYYYDKELTQKVSSEDLVKSYARNYYLKENLESGYSMIIFIYDDVRDPEIFTTNSGSVTLGTNYEYLLNDVEVSGTLNLVGGQVYIIKGFSA